MHVRLRRRVLSRVLGAAVIAPGVYYYAESDQAGASCNADRAADGSCVAGVL